jgi:hypothetical protein
MLYMRSFQILADRCIMLIAVSFGSINLRITKNVPTLNSADFRLLCGDGEAQSWRQSRIFFGRRSDNGRGLKLDATSGVYGSDWLLLLDDVDISAGNNVLIVEADIVFVEDAATVSHEETLSGDFKSLTDASFEFACCRRA